MSRFFRAGNDSSSDSSSDEEELYSDPDVEEQDEEESDEDDDDDDEEGSEASGDEDVGKKGGAKNFLVDTSSESEESDAEGTAKVKSAKDKRYDELDAIITAITNGKKINDWGSISTGP